MNIWLLIGALLLDAALGEPRWLWSRLPHPAVLMGRAVAWLDLALNRANQRMNGVIAVSSLVAGGGLFGWIVESLLPLGWLWSMLIAAVLLAQNSLIAHVRAVASELRYGLPGARRAVAMIVGRDVSELDTPGVARAAIESAAENVSDGVIAPAFWYLIAGLPGIVIYKLVNTADSMIGYRTERYERFGWAAARLDDVLNWIPARLTAGLIALTYLSDEALRVVARDARLHRSPNAGWPEAAMAGVLGISLSGPRSYHGAMRDYPWVNISGTRDIGAAEIEAATGVLWRLWAVMLGLLLLAGLILT